MPVIKKFGEEHIDEGPPSTLVLGIGGAGRNIVEEIGEISSNVEICEVGTSSRPPKLPFLSISKKDIKQAYNSEINLRERPLTRSEEKLKNKIKDFEILYLIAGLGGRTGSWTVPVCAQLGKKYCSFTMGLLAMPFESESANRKKLSKESQAEANKYLDVSAVFPNSKLLDINSNLPISKAFSVMNRIIRLPIVDFNAVITKSDISDMKEFCRKIDELKIGAAYGKGRKKGLRAAKEALRSPWLEGFFDFDKVLTVITAKNEKEVMDVEDALEEIQRSCPDADMIWGLRKNSKMEERIRVTILAGKEMKYNQEGKNF